jgi:predicted enzyme related to lactoylglutathione lyase
MSNSINWFEIPVTDFERASKFYGHITGNDLHKEQMGPFTMGFLGGGDTGVHGAIVAGDGYEPSTNGALIYLNGGDDLSGMLAKVEEAGGSVVVPKTEITPEIGFFAIFMDSEGNKVAMHSPK